MFKKLLTCLFILWVCLFINMACFAKDNSIKVFHLDNGHTVVIKEVHTNPIVTVDTWIRTGSVNENDKNNGVSHFLEHLLFKGTKNHKLGEAERILESKGATYNAATSKDFTHFYTTIASQYAKTAVDLQADMLLNAIFPEDEVNRERKVVQEEIRRSQDNPGRILFNNLSSLLFKSHPYKYETLGTSEIIENIPRQEILNYYHKWYTPSNMITVIVGDIDTNKMLSLVKEKYKTDLNNQDTTSNYPREPYIKSFQEKVEKGNYNSGYMLIGFKGVPIINKKDNYTLDLASVILGQGRSSRLYQNVKEKLNLVSSVSAGHQSLRDDSVFYIDADLKPENYILAKNAILKELDKLRNTKVTQEELKRAKTKLQRDFLYNSESIENIANSVGYNMAIGGKLDYYTKYIDNINKITANDIQKAVNEYLPESRMAISILMPNATSNSLYKSKESYENTSKHVLNNGLTLLADKNDSNDIISLSIFVKGGQLVEPKPGLSSLIAATLLKGTTSKSALEIAQELENAGIIIAPSSNSDYFEIQLKSTKADFEKALEILADIVNNPSFKEEYIKKAKDNILQGIQESRDTPSSYAFEKFTRAMYPNHPYGYIGDSVEKNLPNISRDDMIKFYKELFIPENMIVSVSGNIDTENLINQLYLYFPESKGRKVNLNNLNLNSKKTLAQNQLTSVKKDTTAAWMLLGWPVTGIIDDKEYASLKVINTILGNGLSSRLFVNLREKQGLAYAVSSIYPSRLDNSFFVLYIGTSPDNVEIVKKGFLQEIEKIKTESINKKELNEAKQKLIGQFALSQETNQEKAHYLGWFETIGKGYKYNYNYSNLINSVTAEDITKTANKYFNNPYIISVVGPAKNVDRLEKDLKGESKR